MSSNAVTTIPSISLSTNQSSLTSSATKPNSHVMATMTPIMPSVEKYVIAASELYYLLIGHRYKYSKLFN